MLAIKKTLLKGMLKPEYINKEKKQQKREKKPIAKKKDRKTAKTGNIQPKSKSHCPYI
ncbi:hypothetical protein BsIDN1_46340 [Bacillus safensis]|uniref:Uncharacterized protein n=1 Tax=Bacillus safensis TaxID=561879 RepID=A0A5S9MHC5_BACIA|nr:hypothetical protein BsIDN1_46340 [Bacillus safensis]